MANKCAGCGKFTGVSDSVKCARCSQCFHRGCVTNVSPETRMPKWLCKGCKPKACSPVVMRASEIDATTQASTITSPPSVAVQTVESVSASDLYDAMNKLRQELIAVSTIVSSFKEEISLLKETLSEVDKRVGQVENRLTLLENKLPSASECSEANLMDEIVQLKVQINEREQEALMNDIDIAGIPERSGENLQHIIGLIATKLNVNIEERDVVYVERSGPRQSYTESGDQPRPRPIVVRLAHRSARDQLIKAARVRRGADTTGFDLDFEPTRFYVNERLTRLNRYLFYKAREEGRKNGWRYVWTREGRIFARRDKDSVVHKIKKDNDLLKVFGESRI